ncbi:hypothetical protein F511_44631 [Dorcoceras hygrometricum]|uniref:Uncharacterized protein n=1 Tax=Dorcoceras hygrometricum TaxID=472368 RepID=A0A2Z7BEH1_9LAMI|nr:hypothetical protein F511_44631 [Dorcoceras hygrometricum]
MRDKRASRAHMRTAALGCRAHGGDPNLGSDTTVGEPWRIRIAPPGEAAEEQNLGRETINTIPNHAIYEPFIGCFSGLPFWRLGAWLRPVSRGNRHFTVGGGRLRQSGPRSEMISLRSACTRRLKDFIANGFSSKSWPEQVRLAAAATACTGGGGVRKMDEVVANVNTSETVLESNLVRKFLESLQQITSDLDFVKMQLAELVNHFKEISDSKKGEGESSEKRRLL